MSNIQTPDQAQMSKPMLAAPVDFNKLEYPVLCQPKIDGIRAIIRNGVALSRSMKPIPNRFVQDYFKSMGYHAEGLDGELIVGDIRAKELFQETTSGVMTRGGEPDFTYLVFDVWSVPDHPAVVREQMYQSLVLGLLDVHGFNRVKAVPTFTAYEPDDVKRHMEHLLEAGAEGMILRQPDSMYKFGRSTVNEGSLLKWKQFVDEEGTVVGFEELMHNENEQFTSETGHSKRSAHMENKVAGNMLGALVVRNPKYRSDLRVGSGFDMAMRQEIWDNRPAYLGQKVKYKYFPIGMKDLPRHPIFLGFRHEEDMS